MLQTKQEKPITSGEFAKLSQTTKRTVQWYTNQGLLKPKSTNVKGYRFYSINQIVDLQVIMLLRKLNFSLLEIKEFLKKKSSAKELFEAKKKELLKEAKDLQKKIRDISLLYDSLETEGILFKPTIKKQPSFEAFFIEKTGPYARILDYCFELQSYLTNSHKNTPYFVLFPDREYAPKKDRLKIGIVRKNGIAIKKGFEHMVQQASIPGFKAISYKHEGSPALISMIIMQMHRYMDKKGLHQDVSLPINELEFYIRSSLHKKDLGLEDWVSEINIPIR